jgi:hypothetical protein
VNSDGNFSGVGEYGDHSDGSVEAAVEIGNVVEKDDAGDAGLIGWFAKISADDRFEAAGFEDEGAS